MIIEYEAEQKVKLMTGGIERVSGAHPSRSEGKEENPKPKTRDCPFCRAERGLLDLHVWCLTDSAHLTLVLQLDEADFAATRHRLFYDTPDSLQQCIDEGKNAQLRIICYYKLFTSIYGRHRGERRERVILPMCCVGVIRTQWPGGANNAEAVAIGFGPAPANDDNDGDQTSDAESGSESDEEKDDMVDEEVDSDGLSEQEDDWDGENDMMD